MPGPAPTPTEKLKARGTFRKHRHAGRAEPNGEKPDCPNALQGEARAEWDFMIAELSRLKLLDRIDRGMVTAACAAWAQLEEAICRLAELAAEQERLAKKLERCKVPGTVKAVAALLERADRERWRARVTWRQAHDAYLRALDRLGVGPIGRCRVKVDAGQGSKAPEKGKGRFFKPKVAEGT